MRDQKNCRESGCHRKGYWIEERPDGEKVFAFRTRHDGQNHAVKFSLDEIREIVEQGLSKVELTAVPSPSDKSS